MRREHHRRYQGRFTRLAILARSLTAPATAGLLLAIATPLVIMPMPAQAQTVTTLVSNIGQGSTGDVISTTPHSQRFTTGSNASGYTLSGVDVVFVGPDGYGFAVQVCTVDASGHATSSCTDRTAPASFAAGTLSFTVPANTTLAARIGKEKGHELRRE